MQKETVAIIVVAFIAVAAMGGYIYYLNGQIAALIDNAYREYKYNYVWHVWRNLNYTEWHLMNNDTQEALFTMDSALSRFRVGGWVRDVMKQHSADYRDLENSPAFTDDVDRAYERLLSIRAHIYDNNVTASDLAFIGSAQEAFLLWSDGLSEPVGGAYRISNSDAIKSSFHALTK